MNYYKVMINFNQYIMYSYHSIMRNYSNNVTHQTDGQVDLDHSHVLKVSIPIYQTNAVELLRHAGHSVKLKFK